jgi:Trk K+ transport system NAD-binding subunit
MASHTVLIGYGDTGRVAADVLTVDHPMPRLVVIDTDPDSLRLVTRHGGTPVLGDGADLGVLRNANAHNATQVIVAVADDAAAVRIIAAVRWINAAATIITVVRHPRWRSLAQAVGADQVVVAEQIVGRLLGLSVRQPAQADRIRQMDAGDLGLAVAERAVRDSEIGRAPSECGALVLAVVRGGERVWLDDPDVASLRPDDRLLVLRASTRDE